MAKEKPKRKSKKESSYDAQDILEPLDLDIIGSKSDPCFGKLYDLKAPECAMCGDSELCQIVNSQTLNVLRMQEEKKTNFTDMEVIVPVDEVNEVKIFYEDALLTLDKTQARRLTKEKFNLKSKQFKSQIK